MERGALVLITGKDPLDAGGHESYVRAHALAAGQIGFEPHLFCLGRRAAVQYTPFGVVHRVAALPRRQPPALLQVPLPAQLPWLARSAASFLATVNGPRLIHGFGIFAAAGPAASMILARRGLAAVPVASAYATRAHEIRIMQTGLQRYHGPAHRLRYRAWLRWVHSVDDAVERWGYTHSRLVLVNYASVQRLLVRSYGPRLNLRRIPYCAPGAFEPVAPATKSSAELERDLGRLRPWGAPLIVCVSRHDPRKGVDLLLRALHRLRIAGVPFRACLIGPGKLLGAHRRLAVRLGLEGQVAQPGSVPDAARYLKAADVFVLPSLGEASGSVSVLEALQCGTAIVASACDGIPEDLTDELDALLVPPGDVEALAEALAHLLTDRGLRGRLAAAAHTTYKRRFSAKRFVDALGDVYRELAVS